MMKKSIAVAALLGLSGVTSASTSNPTLL